MSQTIVLSCSRLANMLPPVKDHLIGACQIDLPDGQLLHDNNDLEQCKAYLPVMPTRHHTDDSNIILM